MLKSDGSDRNIGSLLRLFKSSFFDTWLCISYLFKYSKNQGVVDYLCNELYRLSNENPEDLDFYITQLCILLLHQSSLSSQQTSLERFLLDQCAKSIRFSIKACWIFQGFVEDKLNGDPSNPQLASAIRLREFCEIACVNCKRPTYPPHGGRSSLPQEEDKENAEVNSDYDGEFWQLELTKKDRADYFNSILTFVDKLGSISQRLTRVPLDHRAEKLVEEITTLNTDLPAGLYLPLWRDARFNYHCIVRIPPGDSKILNSRERVPFMLTLELLQSNEDVSSKNIHKIASSYFSIVQNNKGGGIELMHGSDEVPSNLNPNPISIPIPATCTPPLDNPEPSKCAEGSKPLSIKGPFGLRWEDRMSRLRRTSPFGNLPNWSAGSVIVKYGDDLRQEQLASQLLTQFKRIWSDAGLPLWIKPYEILVTSSVSGLIETIPNAISLHNLKKSTPNFTTLLDFFIETFGEVSSESFKAAQKNFVESMAAYSIVCYLLQIKDRHNGNILLDTEGHIIHIDFGFMLSNSPGNMYFESAPFKLTQEFVDVMGGTDNRPFQYFKALCIRGFLEVRKHMDKIVTLVEMMMTLGPSLPSFIMGQSCVVDLTTRFNISLTERECVSFVEELIADSLDHFKTRAYDKYQSYVNGILP
jgi:hypothetical protein